MCTVLLPPGVNPIAGNKYIKYHTLYHIVSYIISYHKDKDKIINPFIIRPFVSQIAIGKLF